MRGVQEMLPLGQVPIVRLDGADWQQGDVHLAQPLLGLRPAELAEQVARAARLYREILSVLHRQ